MEGEYFHVALTDDTKPFCVWTPSTIPFDYQDKLKAELEGKVPLSQSLNQLSGVPDSCHT